MITTTVWRRDLHWSRERANLKRSMKIPRSLFVQNATKTTGKVLKHSECIKVIANPTTKKFFVKNPKDISWYVVIVELSSFQIRNVIFYKSNLDNIIIQDYRSHILGQLSGDQNESQQEQHTTFVCPIHCGTAFSTNQCLQHHITQCFAQQRLGPYHVISCRNK